MKWELDESQVQRLKEWQAKIKKKHGEYGQFTFSFTPTGIGTAVKIYSHKTKKVLDLSDYEKW